MSGRWISLSACWRKSRRSNWLYSVTGQTHRIRLERLLELVYRALIELFSNDSEVAGAVVWEDFRRSGLKGVPAGLRPLMESGCAVVMKTTDGCRPNRNGRRWRKSRRSRGRCGLSGQSVRVPPPGARYRSRRIAVS